MREEEARREYEEYVKLKEQFTVDAEGIEVQEQADVSCVTSVFLPEVIRLSVGWSFAISISDLQS